MKIIIEGNSRELAEIAKVFSVVESKAKSDGVSAAVDGAC